MLGLIQNMKCTDLLGTDGTPPSATTEHKSLWSTWNVPAVRWPLPPKCVYPETLKVTFFGYRVFLRELVRMSPSHIWWAINQWLVFPIKREKCSERWSHKKEGHGKPGLRLEWCSNRKRNAQIAGSLQKPGGNKEWRLFRAFTGSCPADNLIWDIYAPDLWEYPLLLLWVTNFVLISYGSPCAWYRKFALTWQCLQYALTFKLVFDSLFESFSDQLVI